MFFGKPAIFSQKKFSLTTLKSLKSLKSPFPQKSSPACFLAGGGTKPLTADRYLMPYFARISTTGC